MESPQTQPIDWKSIATDQCKLSIYLHPQFTGYAVSRLADRHLHHIDGEYMEEKSPLPELPARLWLEKYHNLLDLPFGQVHIGVYSSKFTLLPDLDIRSDMALEQLCRYDRNQEQLFSEEIDKELQLHFAISKHIIHLLSDHFSKKTICFGESGWLSKLKASNTDQVSIHLLGTDLLLAAVEDGQIKYLNRFEAINAEEILYYTLLVYKVLGYDTNSVRLTIHGFVEKLSPIYKQLYGYIATVEMGDEDQSNTDIYQPDVSSHYYTNLLYL